MLMAYYRIDYATLCPPVARAETIYGEALAELDARTNITRSLHFCNRSI